MDSKKSKYRDKLTAIRKAKDSLSQSLSNAGNSAKERIKELDSKHAVSERTSKSMDSAKEFVVDNQFDVAGENLTKVLVGTAKWGHALTKKGAEKIEQKIGVTQKFGQTSKWISETIVTPSKDALSKSDISSNATRIANTLRSEYGELRAGIKTYPEPENIEQQLKLTREQLVKITSCILQMNDREAESWLGSFGKLVSAKTAGIVAGGSLLGLVSTFGTAGTGAAISGLYGAASYSATLAWVGGWVGGGVAAGKILTAGIGILAGIAAFKFMGSEVRQYDQLSDTDKALIETAGMLVIAIDDALAMKPIDYSKTEAESLVNETLIPLYEEMIENADDICSRLDRKHSLKFREHLLWDFEPVVIDGFQKIKQTLPIDLEAVIGGVFYALLSRSALDGTFEQNMVMEALRRSKNDFHEANESEISNYLSTRSPIQLQGFANNVKGITHELIYAHKYNETHSGTFARIMESTNHPGHDIEIVDTETGEVLKRIQMKATSGRASIDAHNEKYSDSDTMVLATEETAIKHNDISSSGISNAELTKDTNSVMENVADNTILDRSIESAGIVGLAAIGKEAILVLQGKNDSPVAIRNAISSTAQAAAATGITAYLFS